MKPTLKRHLLALLALASSSLVGLAQLAIPSDGSDGVFKPESNIEVDLGAAMTAEWTTPGVGNGVYDPVKWAVVFKYESVSIPAGVKVTFKNHPTSAPVVWLVRGNVDIQGEVSVSGKDGSTNAVDRLLPPEGGPGGFRGGAVGPLGSGAAHGPGSQGVANHLGGHSTHGWYARRYGNPQIIPLIGGSGAGQVLGHPSGQGGAGGGAILIAAGGTIGVGGRINANGGRHSTPFIGRGDEFTGSGGAIRLISTSIEGSGSLTALGVTNERENGDGRIRIETFSLSPKIRIFPETVGVPPATPPVLWPSENAPTARILSVDAINAPIDPRAPLIASADVAIQNNNDVIILIETQNFPREGVVELFIIPKFGDRISLKAAYLNGDLSKATWQVKAKLPQGFATLQARATQP